MNILNKKTASICFIFTYLGVLLFCIFARIESWPFSDYRVFKNNAHPKYVKVVRPYFKLMDGEYFDSANPKIWLYIDRSYFDKAFRKMDEVSLDSYLSKLAQSKKIAKYRKNMIEQGFIPLKFVPMAVTFKKENNKWKQVLKPLKEYDL